MVRLGFIAYGIMGERLLRAALAHPHVAVSGLWDPSPRATARLAADLPEVARLDSPEAVIAASDAVYVASPPASHLADARAALGSGRAVFCEKPLAVDLADARAFAAEHPSPRAAVNFPFASSPAVDQLRAWVAQGAVGAVERLEIEVAFRAWPRPWQQDAAAWLDARGEGGFTREVVSHFLFLARRMLGPLQLLDHGIEYPDDGRSERGIRASLEAGGVSVALAGRVGGTDKDDHNAWTLHGSSGSVRLRDWSVAERLADGGWTQAPDALPNERLRPLVLARQLDKVAALARSEPQDLATVAEALDVQAVVETILGG
jgi:predicted dehydrogenase